MADYRLIAADIDGTLLNKKSELTDRTIRAIKAATAKGVYFVLSTGRPYQGIAGLVKKLGIENMPHILYNGAMVTIGGKIVYSLTLDREDAVSIAEEGHRRNSTMICWSNNKLYSEFVDEKIIFYKSITGVEPIVVNSLAEVAPGGITKFVWYDGVESTNKNYAELKAKMGDRVNVAPSRVDFLEFF
ncbi:MAG: HAD-IIB family hydrolase, partial [Clostridia bacterium]|nr:HAD-IIB family hydrolase [Clostridia bacterium]